MNANHRNFGSTEDKDAWFQVRFLRSGIRVGLAIDSRDRGDNRQALRKYRARVGAFAAATPPPSGSDVEEQASAVVCYLMTRVAGADAVDAELDWWRRGAEDPGEPFI